MANFLVFGSGFVAEPLVEYLTRLPENHVVIASNLIREANILAAKFPRVSAVEVDVTDAHQVNKLFDNIDVVVSLVPAPFHPMIARAAIDTKTDMVTASYESPAMQQLALEAEQAGISILNEIGLDPGIDHLSAMKVIDHAHKKGEKVKTFVSWCGGLPAPQFNDNPLGYKFSWAPKGVLTAILNEAIFLRNGKVEKVPAKDLLDWAKPLTVQDLQLEGYPNRESTSYQKSYAIPEAENILRGTLRYKGFCSVVQAAKSLQLLSTEKFACDGQMSWKDYISALNETEISHIESSLDQDVYAALDWLGCFSEQSVASHDNPLDAFCQLLISKLSYQKDETDMVVLQHKFEIIKANGESYWLASTLRAEGQVGGYTAMSKTVGYPAAIAAQMMADNLIEKKGLILPVTADIYQPILDKLELEGIVCHEQETKDEQFLSELAY